MRCTPTRYLLVVVDKHPIMSARALAQPTAKYKKANDDNDDQLLLRMQTTLDGGSLLGGYHFVWCIVHLSITQQSFSSSVLLDW